jgi:hypothetical protein
MIGMMLASRSERRIAHVQQLNEDQHGSKDDAEDSEDHDFSPHDLSTPASKATRPDRMAGAIAY